MSSVPAPAPSPAAPSAAVREVRLTGVVQGVGFRPFVHRMALRHGLDGWVRNESGAVRVLVAGAAASIEAFVDSLRRDAPPLARIDDLRSEVPDPMTLIGIGSGFRIQESETRPDGRLPVSPDVALCASCESELLDPGDRRYHYPFITCTDCGPRFTVIESMPYDRERTSMRAFPQCPACLAEYGNPADRRYHSETNSCPVCGPRVWFEWASGQAGREFGEGQGGGPEEPSGDPRAPSARWSAEGAASTAGAMEACARLLEDGGILALRGLGGFHLAVDARREDAVARLRLRKHRESKPLAVMVRTVEEARGLGRLGPEEEVLLGSAERPIVLISTDPSAGLAPSIAPGMDTVGVMTAYTPLHHLLLEAFGGPLVMTSGNRSEEPIATGNEEARIRLSQIADGFLLHDREIVARYDDSVVRVVDGAPVFLRRARGYAPLPLNLPIAAEVPILAVGPHLKNTFALAEGTSAFVSQHIGDLENLETLQHFRASLDRLQTLFRIQPEAVVADLHPAYLSTRVALEFSQEQGIPLLPPVQHHHAHVAAVLGEWGRVEPALGLAFDGTGYGEDGAVWGAEFLAADLTGYRRLAHLDYAPLPGGDLAARNPWRTALGYLHDYPGAGAVLDRLLAPLPMEARETAQRQVERGLNSPMASSMGRLFDAASAIMGLRPTAAFEGQAPMELEALSSRCSRNGPGPLLPPLQWSPPQRPGDPGTLDPRPLLMALAEEVDAGVAPEELAAAFHESVVASVATTAIQLARAEGLRTVVLGGGVFQNARLLSGLGRLLESAGLEVLRPRALSPNDGAIAFGQAVVAAARLARGHAVDSWSEEDRNSGPAPHPAPVQTRTSAPRTPASRS